MAYLSREQIERMGFASLGQMVLISSRASFYNCSNISIGNHVRIDDFCVLSAGVGGINIGNYIHVAVATTLIGAGKITLSDFCNLSSRVSIYSSSDDYTGEFMTNPMVPTEYTGVKHADVFLGKHVIVGSGTVILPGAMIGEGTAVGALSLVAKSLDPFEIYAGSPLKHIRSRCRRILELEMQMLLATTDDKDI